MNVVQLSSSNGELFSNFLMVSSYAHAVHATILINPIWWAACMVILFLLHVITIECALSGFPWSSGLVNCIQWFGDICNWICLTLAKRIEVVAVHGAIVFHMVVAPALKELLVFTKVFIMGPKVNQCSADLRLNYSFKQNGMYLSNCCLACLDASIQFNLWPALAESKPQFNLIQSPMATVVTCAGGSSLDNLKIRWHLLPSINLQLTHCAAPAEPSPKPARRGRAGLIYFNCNYVGGEKDFHGMSMCKRLS